jgi:hypothetical protein
MMPPVRVKRLTAATLATSALVFGLSVLAGNGRAQAARPVTYSCTATDRQFISTVSTNLTQLGYWSDALVSHDVLPGVVVKQAKDESDQVRATGPNDRTLHATRDLLSSMFLEYSHAVSASAHGRSGQKQLVSAWRLAHSVHDLLAGAKDGLAAKGCDVSPLLTS